MRMRTRTRPNRLLALALSAGLLGGCSSANRKAPVAPPANALGRLLEVDPAALPRGHVPPSVAASARPMNGSAHEAVHGLFIQTVTQNDPRPSVSGVTDAGTYDPELRDPKDAASGYCVAMTDGGDAPEPEDELMRVHLAPWYSTPIVSESMAIRAERLTAG